jgi:hypothetical protein
MVKANERNEQKIADETLALSKDYFTSKKHKP